MNTVAIVLGIVLLVVLYYLYVYFFKSNVLASKLDLATQQSAITAGNLSKPDSTRYAYECWIFVYKSTSVTGTPYIFSRAGSTTGTKNIGLKLDMSNATLKLEYDNGTANSPVSQTITTNFPFQSWTHIIVSVDNKYIDTYINGKLASSIKDKDLKAPSSTSSVEFGQLNAYLAGFNRYTDPIDPQTAWSKYSAGTGSSPLSKYLGTYGMDISLKQDAKEFSKLSF